MSTLLLQRTATTYPTPFAHFPSRIHICAFLLRGISTPRPVTFAPNHEWQVSPLTSFRRTPKPKASQTSQKIKQKDLLKRDRIHRRQGPTQPIPLLRCRPQTSDPAVVFQQDWVDRGVICPCLELNSGVFDLSPLFRQ